MSKIKLDLKLRRQIQNDWSELFPSLGKQSTDLLRRRVGPIMLSLWLEKMTSDEVYRPRSSVVPLCNNYEILGAHLTATPDLGLSFASWREHERGKGKQMAESLRKNALLPIEGSITLSMVIETYKKMISSKDYGWGEWELQDPAFIAGWAGRSEVGIAYLNWSIEKYREVNKKIEGRLEEAKEKNDLDDIERYTNRLKERNADIWYKKAVSLVKDQKTLQDYTQKHVERMKIGKLPYEDLIIDL
jgi:hypothetical protein